MEAFVLQAPHGDLSVGSVSREPATRQISPESSLDCRRLVAPGGPTDRHVDRQKPGLLPGVVLYDPSPGGARPRRLARFNAAGLRAHTPRPTTDTPLTRCSGGRPRYLAAAGAITSRAREERPGSPGLIDARFDPAQALAGTIRYLAEARQRLGRDDLAIVSYHMGIGNLTNVLRAYAGVGTDASIPELVANDDLSWARIYFDSTPMDHTSAYGLLSRLGDDSPTYYWRVLAAQEIMRLYRDDPTGLRALTALQTAKASAEDVLHPPSKTRRFADANDLDAAWQSHLLQPLPNDPRSLGFAIDSILGELAARLGQPKSLYRGLRAEALALLVYLADRVHLLSGATQPLQITSAVRDDEYQDLLRAGNPEATNGYSLHTTGYSFDVRRRYQSAAQARAFQFELDNLTARGLISWVREPAAIHITVSSDAAKLIDVVLQPAP